MKFCQVFLLFLLINYSASFFCPLGGSDDTFNEVNLMLYTSPNYGLEVNLYENSNNVARRFLDHGFDVNKPTKIFVHGFTSNGRKYCTQFIEAYASSTWDVNLICLDWSEYADTNCPLYIRAAENAVKVGVEVGQKFISKLLIKTLKQNPRLIHVIGHSLGAHLSGHIGRNSGVKIGRITGLDPARPYFDKPKMRRKRLSKNDADFVDVIHTNSGELKRGCLSIPRKIGHVDFYPNGGHFMPSCKGIDKIPNPLFYFANKWLCIKDIFVKGACSHERANLYYVDSIRHRNDPNYYFLIKECAHYPRHCIKKGQLPMGERLQREM